jgi:hypothetical protein
MTWMTGVKDRRMNTDALVELSDRLDMQAAILAIMGGEQIDVALYLKASSGLRGALAEIERLRSDAAVFPKVLAENKRLRFDTRLHLQTAAELREARAEIERLKSDHLRTATELREAIAENERLRLEAVPVPPRSDVDADLYRSKLDRGMNTPTFWPTDWFLKLLSPYTPRTD